MTEIEMLDALQKVWENMSMDKDREMYGEMLVLLDDMRYFLRYDLQCEYPLCHLEETVKKAEFNF